MRQMELCLIQEVNTPLLMTLTTVKVLWCNAPMIGKGEGAKDG